MRKLIRHDLNSNLTWPFVEDSLDGSNNLSIELLHHLNKDTGRFFTLLPETANLENLYHFKSGILPQNPVKYGPIGGFGKQHYSETTSITDELAHIIENTLHNEVNISCVIDDVTRYSTDKKFPDCSNELKNCMAYAGRDIYYLTNKGNAKLSLIIECLNHSRAYWHSLCILSKISLKDHMGKQLETPILTQICKNAQMIVIGAYDGEGYVFWEKNLL